MILDLRPANERRRYNVMPSLTGYEWHHCWSHPQPHYGINWFLQLTTKKTSEVHINGLVQASNNYSALALELLLSGANPSISVQWNHLIGGFTVQRVSNVDSLLMAFYLHD